MNKKKKQIIFIVIVFLLIFFIWFLVWKLISTDEANEIVIDDLIQVANVEVGKQEEKDKYLLEAEKILTHLDSQKDDYAFYGGVRQCYYNNNKKCNWIFSNNITTLIDSKDLDKISKYSTQRNTLPIIWARFQYYKKTGDEEQLQKIYQDIDILMKVIDDEWLNLQTDSFNCLLMKEIIESDLIQADYQKKAQKICNENIFEVHPQSLIFYNQNRRQPLIFTDVYDYVSVNYPSDYAYVRLDENKKVVDKEKFAIFDLIELKSDIQRLIVKIASDGELDESEKKNVFFEKRESFIIRENFAVIDRLAAMQINKNQGNDELKQENELDYLILLKEALSYYLFSKENYESVGRCLLFENIEYYNNEYSFNLNETLMTEIKNKSHVDFYDKDLLSCFLVKKLLNGKVIDRNGIYKDVLLSKQNSLIGDEWPGYFKSLLKEYNVNDDPRGDHYISTELNAILAGLLIKEKI